MPELHLHVHELPQKSWSGTNTTCYKPIVVLFNGGDGVPLAALDKLKDGQLPALPASSGMRQKASFRLDFDMNRKRNRQYNVHRLLNNGTTWESITKAEMASIIALEMKQLMEEASAHACPLRTEDGEEIKFEDIMLCKVERVSKGSFQPVFKRNEWVWQWEADYRQRQSGWYPAYAC